MSMANMKSTGTVILGMMVKVSHHLSRPAENSGNQTFEGSAVSTHLGMGES
jgi:hypothetical protein